MKILRYTEAIQKQIGSKTKPEPWMHIGIQSGKYAIWIWDTRQIVGTGKFSGDISKLQGTAAKDNHKPLVGEHADAFVFGKRGARTTPANALFVITGSDNIIFASSSDKAISAAKRVADNYSFCLVTPISDIRLGKNPVYDCPGGSAMLYTDQGGSHGIPGQAAKSSVLITEDMEDDELQDAKAELDKSNAKPVPELVKNIAIALNNEDVIAFDKRDKATVRFFRDVADEVISSRKFA